MASGQASGAERGRRSVRLSDPLGRLPLVMEASRIPASSVQLQEEEDDDDRISGLTDGHYSTTEFLEIPSDDDLGLETPLEELTSDFVDPRERKLLRSTPDLVSDIQRGHAVATPPITDMSRNNNEGEVVMPSLKQDHALRSDTPSASFQGSEDELAAADNIVPSRFSKTSEQTQRSSESCEQRMLDPIRTNSSKAEKILGAHRLAHEITLQALMRDEDVIGSRLDSITTANRTALRASLLPPSLRIQDTRGRKDRSHSASQRSSKRVHVIPPPLDTSGPRNSLPLDFLPTPYPFPGDETEYKDARPQRSLSRRRSASHQRILLVRLRGTDPKDPKQRSTTLVVPPTNHFSIARASRPGQTSDHPTPSFFDDEDFFQQLRLSYVKLSGKFRFLSARSLRRISIFQAPSVGQSDTPLPPFSVLLPPGTRTLGCETELLQRFHKPSLGRAKYRFVRWAYQLAGQTSPPADYLSGFALPTPDSTKPEAGSEMEGPGVGGGEEDARGATVSLDLVVDWSAYRIACALVSVILLSMLAALLWVFLGPQTHSARPAMGGYRDAGDRVGPGMVLSIAVLLLGISVFAGWLGLSWVVM